jgi:FkbM family methyltransferase
MLRRISRKASHLGRDIRHAGIPLTVSFHLRGLIRGLARSIGRKPQPTTSFRIPGLNGSLKARWATSDISVFHSIFLSGHYGALGEAQAVRTIVDCGANVGYSGVYLMRQFPAAKLVAIEPEQHNVELCRYNLAGFDGRASIVQAAVWPHASHRLAIDLGPDGRAQPWAFQVHKAGSNESSDVVAVTIPEVMERFGLASIDILKIDIEGSERRLFESGLAEWLGRVRNLAVELHDDASRQIFAEAMSGYEYTRKDAGQLTFCFNLKARTAETMAPASGRG